MNKIFTADNIVEVGLIRAFLEQNDIPSELRNHHTSSLLGEIPFTSIWPELWVEEGRSDKAIELISQLKRDEVNGPDWVCDGCKETNPASFDICWQCGELNSDNVRSDAGES